MSKTKIGVFSILMFGVMMLLIPVTSIASAQDYEDRYGKVNNVYYEDDRHYYEDDSEYVYEEYYYPPKDKKMKEPPMLLVKKDVLYCDLFSGSGQNCNENGGVFGPESDRYVQECTLNIPLCNEIIEEAFDMIVTDDIEFPGSEKGKKLTFNGERYTVTEEFNLGIIQQNESIDLRCQESGFDGGFTFNAASICTLTEGECSGIVNDGQLKKCTIKNYLIDPV